MVKVQYAMVASLMVLMTVSCAVLLPEYNKQASCKLYLHAESQCDMIAS